VYCTKCEEDKDSLIDGLCIDCLGRCSGCGLEPIEDDGLCIKCLNAATMEAELYEQQVKDDFWDAVKGI
jgi:hypothetical protein